MAQLNPFEIFNLPLSFKVDEEKLRRKYLEIQKKVHPDRFVNASDSEKRVAQQWSTLINDAFQKLSDPVERGKLICAIRGQVVDENRSSNVSEDFLCAQLERREAIQEALEAQDALLLRRLSEELHTEKETLLSELGISLDQKNDLVEAQVILQKIMFLNRQLKELG